jgi:hypothetical protein
MLVDATSPTHSPMGELVLRRLVSRFPDPSWTGSLACPMRVSSTNDSRRRITASWPKPNIAVTRGNLSDENCACRRQNLRFLESFAKYIAIETDFAANFCDTCLPHIHRRSNRSQNLRVLRTNPASCLPMSYRTGRHRRVGDDPAGTQSCTRLSMSELPLTPRFIESPTGITASSRNPQLALSSSAQSRRNPLFALFAFYQECAQFMKRKYVAWGWQQSTFALA